MAGNKNSGGMRPTAPQNNPANVSATGGAGQSGTQAAKYIPGLPYGQGQETMTQQMSAPMAGPSKPPVLNLPSITPLTAPTERPNEPMTHGMDFGPGAGSEALNLPQERPLSETLANMIQYDSTGDVQAIYDFAVSRGL
jgi:hypothetical protein